MLHGADAGVAKILKVRYKHHELVGVHDVKRIAALRVLIAGTLTAVDIVRALRSCGCRQCSSESKSESSDDAHGVFPFG
jgi:hypothetical protein